MPRRTGCAPGRPSPALRARPAPTGRPRPHTRSSVPGEGVFSAASSASSRDPGLPAARAARGTTGRPSARRRLNRRGSPVRLLRREVCAGRPDGMPTRPPSVLQRPPRRPAGEEPASAVGQQQDALTPLRTLVAGSGFVTPTAPGNEQERGRDRPGTQTAGSGPSSRPASRFHVPPEEGAGGPARAGATSPHRAAPAPAPGRSSPATVPPPALSVRPRPPSSAARAPVAADRAWLRTVPGL